MIPWHKDDKTHFALSSGKGGWTFSQSFSTLISTSDRCLSLPKVRCIWIISFSSNTKISCAALGYKRTMWRFFPHAQSIWEAKFATTAIWEDPYIESASLVLGKTLAQHYAMRNSSYNRSIVYKHQGNCLVSHNLLYGCQFSLILSNFVNLIIIFGATFQMLFFRLILPKLIELATCHVGRPTMTGPPCQPFHIKIDRNDYIRILYQDL